MAFISYIHPRVCFFLRRYARNANSFFWAITLSWTAVANFGDDFPSIQWQHASGGANGEFLTVVKQTPDGGFILGGYSDSPESGNKNTAGFGDYDYWIVKLDAIGTKQWDRVFGSETGDPLWNLQLTSDGGYILGGDSSSGISGNKTIAGSGAIDYWVLKLDVEGRTQWETSLGGTRNEESLGTVQQTSDGGFIVGGSSDSLPSGNKTAPNFGYGDSWLVKLDPDGRKLWDVSFGGDGGDSIMTVRQTSDGGYILGGSSNSEISGNKTSPNRGAGDYWVIKVDATGEKQWETTAGGSALEILTGLELTTDGGCILGGWSRSGVSGNKASPSFGGDDYWVVKLDATGNKQWDRSYGGDLNDKLNSIQATSDGGYLLCGESISGVSGNKTSASFGASDGWAVKIDGAGNIQWESSIGGEVNDVLSSLQQTKDGGYILGGYSNSHVSGNKTVDSLGRFDFWIVKLAPSLRFSSFALDANHIFRAEVSGTPGRNYIFEASTNFTDWSALLTNSASNPTIPVADTNAADFRIRFYRIREHP